MNTELMYRLIVELLKAKKSFFDACSEYRDFEAILDFYLEKELKTLILSKVAREKILNACKLEYVR